MNSSHEHLGAVDWWRRVRVTAIGVVDIMAPPVASALNLTNRLVVLGYQITGLNTNAALTTIELRNKTTTARVLADASMHATTGSCQVVNSRTWLDLIAAETLELNVGGSLTGNVAVTAWGKILPTTTPSGDKGTAY